MKMKLINKISTLLLMLGSFSLSLAQPCAFSHSLSGPLASNKGYRAQTTISSTQAISTSLQVDYQAGTSITLSPGFIATKGCTFSAVIASCVVAIDDLKEGNFGIANYPNPFDGETRIAYHLEASDAISLYIYNATGQVINTLLADEVQAAGKHEVIFDASQLPSGVYFYKLQAGDRSALGRMIVQH